MNRVSTCVFSVLFIIIAIEMKSKPMKVLIFAVLLFSSIQIYAVEFHQCIDKKGQQHFTNLPAESLDLYCNQKTDRYSYLINQDYSNLENKLKNYIEPVEAQIQTNDSLITTENFIDPIKDILDSDKALEQLLETSTKTDENMATEFFNARSNAIESVLSQEKAR